MSPEDRDAIIASFVATVRAALDERERAPEPDSEIEHGLRAELEKWKASHEKLRDQYVALQKKHANDYVSEMPQLSLTAMQIKEVHDMDLELRAAKKAHENIKADRDILRREVTEVRTEAEALRRELAIYKSALSPGLMDIKAALEKALGHLGQVVGQPSVQD